MANVLGSILEKGINTIAPLVASAAGSLVCQWFPLCTNIRYRVGKLGYNTQVHTIIRAQSNMKINNMKWEIQLSGAPYTTKVQNERAMPDGRLPTIIAFAIVKVQSGKRVEELDLSTVEESQGKERVPIYPDRDAVIEANIRYSHGFDWYSIEAGGFRDGTYPGPIELQTDDQLCLLLIATDNYDKPSVTFSGDKGFVTGTITWSIEGMRKMGEVKPSTNEVNLG